MDHNQAKRQAKYEREALREGVAVKTDTGGVLLKVLATRILARGITHPKGRERCGVLGATRTPLARARGHHRAAMKNRKPKDRVSFKAWVRQMGVAA